jgi:alkyl sulfatase BDS1-like metallo-beta-lactamase superfamily hydrolase
MKTRRPFLIWIAAASAVLAFGSILTVDTSSARAQATTPVPGHFHPEGKAPSKFTIELQNGLRKTLPFEDKRDFEEAKKGFIAAPPYKQIMADARQGL